MPDTTIVRYSPPGPESSREVRILLFNNAVHLYDAGSNAFIAAYPYKEFSVLEKNAESALFSVGDGSEIEVPAEHFSLPELLKLSGYGKSRWSVSLSRLKVPLLLTGFLLFAITMYYVVVSGISGIGIRLISPKKEAQLGQMIFDAMLKDATIDTVASGLLTDFAAQLRMSEKYNLKFTVVDDKDVNAFAIPGGHIVVYKGILQQMTRPEELVALIGHESSHINERHSLRNMVQELTGNFVLSMVFGDLGSIGGVIAGRANALRSLSYSRSLEKEADEQGMHRMLSNRIDPQGMVMLMDRLKAAEKDVHLPGFLSTHPLTEERRVHALKFVAEHPGEAVMTPKLESNWEQLKKAIETSPAP